MEDVVKYFCYQADYQYGRSAGFGSNPVCLVKKGDGECIGISGQLLNSKLCAFLSYYYPRSAKQQYDIEWTCKDDLLFPRVIVKGYGSYISTEASERGFLDPQSIGRRQCLMRPETRLLLQKCEESDEQKIENIAALLHDHFRLKSPLEGRNTIRSRLLMFFVEQIYSQSDQIGQLVQTENSLLLFWAPYATIETLKQYILQEDNEENCRTFLSFFSSYCEFMLELLELHQRKRLNFLAFSNRFKEYWGSSLDHILKDLLEGPKTWQHQQLAALFPDKPLGEGLNGAIGDCFDAAAYPKATKPVTHIYRKLENALCQKDSVIQSQMSSIKKYIEDMAGRDKQRHHSSQSG